MNCDPCSGNCNQGRACPMRRTTTDTYEHEPLPKWLLWACWAVFGSIGIDLLIQFARGAL